MLRTVLTFMTYFWWNLKITFARVVSVMMVFPFSRTTCMYLYVRLFAKSSHGGGEVLDRTGPESESESESESASSEEQSTGNTQN